MKDPDPIHKSISELKSKAREFREKSTEFQGLEREFTFIQDELLKKYERSSPHRKHPADLGNIREEILREFLSSTGYLPLKYGVSKPSVRIVTKTGHQSNQIDIAIYDSLNSPMLLSYPSLSFLAIESVYGVIQVKSRLSSRDDINEGLNNIASFKKLEGSDNSFGILFAYDCSLKWTTLAETVKDFMCKNTSSVWTNFVVVLNQGLILPREEGTLPYGVRNHCFRNSDLRSISKPDVIGIPDTSNTLLKFYLYLIDLLKSCTVEEPDLYQYVRLPFTTGEKAYRFTHGEIEEIGQCREHGPYLRKISNETINKIIDICSSSEPTDMLHLFEAVFGSNNLSSPDGDQSEQVYLYNPDNLPLVKILTLPNSIGLQCYSLLINRKTFIIPKYYSFRDKLISECPKCNYPATPTTTIQPNSH
ncbi:MAG: DUF6602 domain-containing protein [Limnoraphis robusta]